MSVGMQVGAYRILEQIGEGGMGSVWIAEHMTLGRRAAIKLLHTQFSGRQDIVNRFFNEARAATAISDPGIVQIFDFGHDADGNAYIVMELLEGEPLDKRLQRTGRFQVHDALRIMRQVASSLGAAHARNIIHRDLKPENIFLVRDAEVIGGERAKILDFGIAKLVGDTHSAAAKTQTSTLMGTPLYMSPEQCRGAGKVDTRSDVYSLGCVMYALLVGRPPFDAEGPGEIILMHMTQQAPPVSAFAPYVSSAVDGLVAKCLAKNPDERFRSGTEMAQGIGALLSSVSNIPAPTGSMPVQLAAPAATTLGGSAGTKAPTMPPAKGRGLLYAGFGGAVLIGAVIAVVLGTRGGDSGSAAGSGSGSGSGSEVAKAVDPPKQAEPTKQDPPKHPDPPKQDPPKQDPPKQPDPPKQVAIVIASTPAGAQVFVGDEKAPRGKTPYTLDLERADMPVELKIVSAGYKPHVEKIAPNADHQLDIKLDKIAVATRPTGGTTTKPADNGDSDDTMDPFHRKQKK